MKDDLVLVNLREYGDEKCDIVHKYFPDEARQLKNAGEIPKDIEITHNQEKGDLNIEFGDEDPADKKVKKKRVQQEWFLPPSHTESEVEEEEDVQETKDEKKIVVDEKQVVAEQKVPKKKTFVVEKESESEAESSSEEDIDELDDI